MVKNEPVSLLRQTIYCIIPILDIYAAYRVTRLRKYLVIMIPIGFALGMVDSTLFPLPPVDENLDNMEISDMFFYGYDSNHFIALIFEQAGLILLAIFLVRRWSKHWNQKFKGSTSE